MKKYHVYGQRSGRERHSRRTCSETDRTKFRNTALRPRRPVRTKEWWRPRLSRPSSSAPPLSLSLSLSFVPSHSLGTHQRSRRSTGTRVHEMHSRRAGPTRNVMRVGKSVVVPLLYLASPSASRVSLNTCAARSLARSLARSSRGRRLPARESPLHVVIRIASNTHYCSAKKTEPRGGGRARGRRKRGLARKYALFAFSYRAVSSETLKVTWAFACGWLPHPPSVSDSELSEHRNPVCTALLLDVRLRGGRNGL